MKNIYAINLRVFDLSYCKRFFNRNRKRKFTLFVVESSQQAAQYSSAIEYLTDLSLSDLTPQKLPFDEKVINKIQFSQVSS